jgi:Mg/Co/Ni transporter MgtE
VPTCSLAEQLTHVRARLSDAGWHICFVVNDEEIVLGLLGQATLAREDDVPVEEAMTAGPSTVRPSLELNRAVDRMRRENLTRLPVTTSEGRLLGLLERDTGEQALRELNRNRAAFA